MKLPETKGNYSIYKNWERYNMSAHGVWKCEIYKWEAKIFQSDNDIAIKTQLSGFSLNKKMILWYDIESNWDIHYIQKLWYKYWFTSDDSESFIKTNKVSINAYFAKKEIDRKNKLIEDKIKSFKNFLGSQKSTIERTFDNLGELEESRDLFLSEVAKIYSENFELIVKEFKSPKIKSQIRNLLHKLTK